MRSTQEGQPSLGEVEAGPESLPIVKTEAQPSKYSLAKTSPTPSAFLETYSGSQIWEKKSSGNFSLVASVSEAQTLEVRAVKAQAWESQAFETQKRSSLLKKASDLEEKPTPVLNQQQLPKNVVVPEEKKKEVPFTRPLWSNKVEYILAQVGYSLRATSIWRFPYLWLHNGGLSFFIIYIILLFLIGIPLLFLEMAVGQKMHQGSIGAWKIISPWVGGVGYTSFMVCLAAGVHVNVINAWTVSYLSHSLESSVPWEHCPLLKNFSAVDPECARTTPSMYFWYRNTLKASDRIEDGGPLVVSLILPLLTSSCLVGVVMINGIKSIGKVMCVLVPVSWFIMLCFFFWSLLLDGAMFGLQHLLEVKISAMYRVDVWCHAGIQVLLSLGLGYGSILSLSSHMNLPKKCLNDAFVVALVNLVFMMFATPFIFCVLGFWATVITRGCSEKNAETLSRLVMLGKLPPEAQPPLNHPNNPASIYTSWINSLPQSIKSMVLSHIVECNLDKQFMKVKEGPRFAFLAFVDAMSFTSGSVFWSSLFFLLLLISGLNVMVGYLQGIITPLQDTFSFWKHAKLLTAAVFVVVILCGLFFLRPSGSYYIRLLNEFCIMFPIIIIIILESIAVGWAYGTRRFLEDLVTLWDPRIYSIFHWLWCWLSPIVLLFLFTTNLILLFLETITYVAWDSSTSKEKLREYPSWILLMMGALVIIVLLPIPAYFVYCLTHGIPFRSTGLDSSFISSKSPPVGTHLTPIKEIQNEEVPYGNDNDQIADQPVV